MRGAGLLSLLLLGCLPTRPAVAPERPTAPAPTPVARPRPCPDPTAVATAPNQPAAPAPLPDPDPTWALAPAAIVLQLDSEPTFSVIVAGDPSVPYGRVAPFTMYEDGTVIVADRRDEGGRVLVWSLGPTHAASHLEHVLALGFPQIRSSSAECIGPPGQRACIADASFRVLRARTAGRLREIRNYAGWEPRRSAQLHAIYDRIDLLRVPDDRARLYLPRAATLFVRAPRDPADLDSSLRDRALPWPLADDLLGPTDARELRVHVLDVPQIQAMIAATGTNRVDHAWFVRDGRLVQASMIPWLPGEDHRPAIARRGSEAGP